jgi:hypothetical protein
MRGQSVLEFIIAAIFFFAIIFYTLSYLNSTVWTFDQDHYANFLDSRSTQISEILVTSPGVWESGIPKSVGLAEEWPVLNSTKISWLNNSCHSDYQNLLRTLEIDPGLHSIDIDIIEEGQPEGLVQCEKTPPDGVQSASTKRIALSDSGKILKIGVAFW